MQEIPCTIYITIMISIISKVAAVASVSCLTASSALAAPYVNIENNSGFYDNEFGGGSTDLHLGFEASLSDSVGFYVQGGPQIQHVKDADSQTEYSGKVGASVAITDHLGAYGEVAAVTNDKDFSPETLNVGTKLGVKYTF